MRTARRAHPNGFEKEKKFKPVAVEEPAEGRPPRSIARNEVQSRLLHTLVAPVRIVFRFDRLLLRGTTLAERLTLRIPGVHDYAQMSTSRESQTHVRRHGGWTSQQ